MISLTYGNWIVPLGKHLDKIKLGIDKKYELIWTKKITRKIVKGTYQLRSYSKNFFNYQITRGKTLLEVKIVLDLFDVTELRSLWVNSSADRSRVKIDSLI